MSGSSEVKARASIVLPDPGGPVMSTLWPPASQRELREERGAAQTKLPAGGHEDGQRDGEVESGALFGHLGRREVDGDPLRRERVARVADRGPDPFACLLNGAVGETHDVELGQPICQVCLDRHRHAGKAEGGAAHGGRGNESLDTLAHGSILIASRLGGWRLSGGGKPCQPPDRHVSSRASTRAMTPTES